MEDRNTDTDDEFDVDSLFDSASPLENSFPEFANNTCDASIFPAQRNAPPILGLFFDPTILISEEMEEKLISDAMNYFHFRDTSNPPRADRNDINNNNNINQAMLFGRLSSSGSSGLPPFLDELLVALAAVLEPHLPMETHEMLFPQNHSETASAANTRSMSRQAILNHYFPGEGITPHVDLLRRFADGIIGVSLGSGTVMTFQKVHPTGESDRWDLYLPGRSIIVLTKDARYNWTHGIDGRSGDYVLDSGSEGGNATWIWRKARTSITLRWLLPGADVVGE